MSRIEQLISEIEEYIDSCKFQALSNRRSLLIRKKWKELLGRASDSVSRMRSRNTRRSSASRRPF